MSQEYSEGMRKYMDEAEAYLEARGKERQRMKRMKFDTIAVHGMYTMEEAFTNGQGGIMEPLIPSTSQAYRDSDEMEAGLSYLIPTWCYSRIHNPTMYYLEETLSLLETYGCDVDGSALCTSSGMAAIKQAVEPLLAKQKDGHEDINFVSSAMVYGGTFQLYNLRMRERGAMVRWVKEPWNLEEWSELIDENTRFIHAEMPSNPQQACFDISEVAKIAHEHEIPLVVDGTVASPALLRPIEHGADIVVHSLTKTVGSSGSTIGGAFIARHDLVSKHLPDEVKRDYATWTKLWPFRDSGPCMSSQSAYQLMGDLRMLRSKMTMFSESTMKVANFLNEHPKVERVDYLGLKDSELHPLATKYMKIVDDGRPAYGHLMSFTVKGQPKAARDCFDGFTGIWRATDLGRIKSVATIPAISTHSQQGEEGQKLASISQNMIRLCVGGEHPDDIIDDLDQALNKVTL